MPSPTYIARTPASSAYSWLRCADPDLAIDLDHAEFAERRPALQPRNFVREIDHILSAAHNDRDAAAYLEAWQAIHDAHEPPQLDTAHPRRQVAAAHHRFKMLCRPSDRSRGLRQMMDDHFHMLMAFADLASLQRQDRRNRKANKVKRDREAIEHARRVVTIPDRDRIVGVRRYG